MSQTRNITVSLRELGNTPIVGARIIISLRGVGLDADGFIAPQSVEMQTNEQGRAVFTLWQNNPDLSDTYYQIRSYHPTSGRAIHRGQIFYVGNSDADLEDLINLKTGLALPPFSPSSGPSISAINLTALADDIVMINLGPATGQQGEQLSYSVSPAFGVAVSGNEAVVSISEAGVYPKTLTVTDGNGAMTSVSFNLSIASSSDYIEYQQEAVIVS